MSLGSCWMRSKLKSWQRTQTLNASSCGGAYRRKPRMSLAAVSEGVWRVSKTLRSWAWWRGAMRIWPRPLPALYAGGNAGISLAP